MNQGKKYRISKYDRAYLGVESQEGEIDGYLEVGGVVYFFEIKKKPIRN